LPTARAAAMMVRRSNATPDERSARGMLRSHQKTQRKRRRIRNKRLRHLKATRKQWKIS